MECSRISSASFSRRSVGTNLESRNPRMRYAGSRITAAATTGPNSDPRPTSSTPATCSAPVAHASFSNLSVQRSFFNSRSFAAEAEIFSRLEFSFEALNAEADLDTDLDTGVIQHLRRRRDAKQEQKLSLLGGRGFAPSWRGRAPPPHKHFFTAFRLPSTERPCPSVRAGSKASRGGPWPNVPRRFCR